MGIFYTHHSFEVFIECGITSCLAEVTSPFFVRNKKIHSACFQSNVLLITTIDVLFDESLELISI